MISGFFQESIVKRAQEKGAVDIELVNLRDFATDSYGMIDDKPYGGGAGMVLKVEPIYKALEKIKHQRSKIKITNQNSKVIYTSPKGRLFDQKKAQEYAKLDHLIILAGHYEGVDERVMKFVDEEVSLGDFVMTGGEIAAATIVDSVVRLLPGVLKKEEATQKESFFEISINQLIESIGEDELLLQLKEAGVSSVKLLEYPQFTRPEEFMGQKVPEILLSGNHQEIEKWRIKKAYAETVKKRLDLLKRAV